ncbi:type II secretion system F family protein [Catenovulum sp. SM1970]|uniref:type II secretion system F family protein n=1 Tax=Marinifaba aquimaris TaxID=2741323 RepID=UPI001571B320|nr:type II secretion system F family protein [Marinifaba aquimaris]NTS76572.1 type II secretion system F family protein [Marinifaba aquimaris]
MAPKNTKNKVKEPSEFQWKGVNRRGEKVNGTLVAETLAQAKLQLRQQGVTPTQVKAKAKSRKKGKVTSTDITVMTRQLATMLAAGVPLVQSVELISQGSDNPALKKLLADIGTDIAAGNPLNQALRKYPLHFDDLYCDLVMAGEQSGALEGIYDRIAVYKEKSEALKSKIKKAMFYPAAVVAIATIVTIILLLFVVPQFQEIFASFGAELPAFTQMVIGISEVLQDHGLKIAAILAIAVAAFLYTYKRNRKLRDNLDGVLLKLPVVGMIVNKGSLARYARTLATTFSAGVPLIEALDSAAGASGNAVYRKAILNIKHEVSAGMQMNIAMRNTNLFPAMVVQMVQIGEESGAIDDMLNKVAAIYEQEVDDAVDGLSSLIEPLIMAVLGVVIGGLIIAMYLPIFEMGKIVG